jgi:hypothetical protein
MAGIALLHNAVMGLTAVLAALCGGIFYRLGQTVLGEKFEHIFKAVGSAFAMVAAIVIVDLMQQIGVIRQHGVVALGTSVLVLIGFISLSYMANDYKTVLRKKDMKIE